jgi:hypothetical protein
LQTHHKIDEYILAMKRFARKRGLEIGVEYRTDDKGYKPAFLSECVLG